MSEANGKKPKVTVSAVARLEWGGDASNEDHPDVQELPLPFRMDLARQGILGLATALELPLEVMLGCASEMIATQSLAKQFAAAPPTPPGLVRG